MKKFAQILFITLMIPMASAWAEVDTSDLLARSDAVLRGDTHTMTVALHVQTARWTRDYKLQVWMEGVDHTFSRVLEPAKVEGQGFLRIKARLWNFLPSAERTILIPPSMMLDQFMGSDFSNDDFVKLSYLPRDYDAALIGEEEKKRFSSLPFRAYAQTRCTGHLRQA